MRIYANIGAPLLVLGCLGAGGAQAGVLSGSFSGIVTSSLVSDGGGPPFSNINGQSASGTFYANTLNCTGQFGMCIADISLTFDVDGLQLTYGSSASFVDFVRVANTATAQTAILETFQPLGTAQLNLVGRPGAFVDGADDNTLHPGVVDLPGTTADFQDGRSFGATIGIDALTFDGAAVPEPASWPILGVGLAILAVLRYRQLPIHRAGRIVTGRRRLQASQTMTRTHGFALTSRLAS